MSGGTCDTVFFGSKDILTIFFDGEFSGGNDIVAIVHRVIEQ